MIQLKEHRKERDRCVLKADSRMGFHFERTSAKSESSVWRAAATVRSTGSDWCGTFLSADNNSHSCATIRLNETQTNWFLEKEVQQDGIICGSFTFSFIYYSLFKEFTLKPC